MKTLARLHTGATVERLLCHPRLPLVAGWDAARPAIRIWEHADGRRVSSAPSGTGPVGEAAPH